MALPQSSHMTRKGGMYYFRRRLPRPYQGEVALSLKTRDFRRAEYVAERLNMHFDALIADPMTDAEKITAALKLERRRLLEETRTRIIAAEYGNPAFNMGYTGPPGGANDADIESTEWAIRQFRSELVKRDLRGPETTIRRSMVAHDIHESAFREYGLGWFAVFISVLEQQLEWLRDGVVPIPAAEAVSREGRNVESVPATTPTDSGMVAERRTLSKLASDFTELMSSTGTWTAQTRLQSQASYRMFIAHCGDRPGCEYSRRDVASFYDVLRGLPALYSKKPEWNKLPLAEVVAMTKDHGVDRLSMTTIKRHFAALGSLFENLRKRGEYPGENPAYGFDFPKGKRVRASDARAYWQGDKLRALFASPVWSGCASEARRSSPGPVIVKDEKYWLPLLGLYHGNRLEEFAQLLRSDVREEEGIWHFDINDEDDKQIKNAQSARRVPLHPKVLALGFLDYVDQIARTPTDRVFPQLKPGGPDKKYGYYFTKWWTRYRQDIGLYEKGLDYHSFRHGVTTKLYGADEPDAVVDMLTGHEGAGTSRRVYLKELPLKRLHDAICKVEWPELASVSHLAT